MTLYPRSNPPWVTFSLTPFDSVRPVRSRSSGNLTEVIQWRSGLFWIGIWAVWLPSPIRRAHSKFAESVKEMWTNEPVEVSIEALHFGTKRDWETIRSNPNLIAGETEGQNCETRSMRKSWGPSCGRDGLGQNIALSSAISVGLS